MTMKLLKITVLPALLLYLLAFSGCAYYMVGGGQATVTYGSDFDQKIKQAVTRKFVRDPSINANALRIKVNSGHVILSGTVEKHWMVSRARKIALSVKGVSSVDSRIKYRHSN